MHNTDLMRLSGFTEGLVLDLMTALIFSRG